MTVSSIAVALDVTSLPNEPVGAGRYIVELARALMVRDDVALTLVARRGDGERIEEIVPGAWVVELGPHFRPARLLYEELALARAVSRHDRAIKVVHGPHYTTSKCSSVAVVTTVHDLTFVEHPEWHEAAKARYFAHALARAARAADGVICVSEHTAERFRERYHPSVPVYAIAHGVDHERFHPADPSDEADRAVLERLAVAEPYVLHLGTIEPRKNVPLLVRAFDALSSRDELTLVLAGQRAWGSSELDRALSDSRSRDRIVELGYVDDRDVPSLVRRATVVAYPSLEEGFGLPALEALACGTALVTTTGTVMAEFAGDAALLVAPGSLDDLVDALQSAVSVGAGPARREIGIERASRFTWQRCAEAHVAAYVASYSR